MPHPDIRWSGTADCTSARAAHAMDVAADSAAIMLVDDIEVVGEGWYEDAYAAVAVATGSCILDVVSDIGSIAVVGMSMKDAGTVPAKIIAISRNMPSSR